MIRKLIMNKNMMTERQLAAWKDEVLKNLKRELETPELAAVFKRLSCVKVPKS